MASPAVAQAVESSTNTAGTSHVITLPTATAGELLLIILDKGSTSATINSHASLTELLDEASANGLYIAYRWMDGTEPSTYTLTSSANTRTASIAYRISGAENPSITPPAIGTTSSGSSATPDPPASATPSGTKDYLFITFYGAAGEEADDDTWSLLPPTNYSPTPPRQKACGTAGTNLGGMIAAAERQLNTGSAENPGTFSKVVSAAWRAQTIIVYPLTVTGSGNADADPAVIDGVGTSGSTGSGNADADPAVIDGVGIAAWVGVGAVAAQAAVVDGTGTVEFAEITGTGDVEAQPAVVDGIGIVVFAEIVGSGSVAADAAQVDGEGVVSGQFEQPPASSGGAPWKKRPVLIQPIPMMLMPITGVGDVRAGEATVRGRGTRQLSAKQRALLTCY